MGAAGRDFHVFNCLYRDNKDVEVVAFTATQIPHIEDRRYPAALAGTLYPDGIPICPEEELPDLLDGADEVVFAYSDVSTDYIDERKRLVEERGVVFNTFDIEGSMLTSDRPDIAIKAVRTG
jgi:predicted GTPase